MKTVKKLGLSFVAISIMSTTAMYPGAAAGGASEPTQILQMVTDIIDRLLSYIKQVNELKAKMKMIAKNASDITDPNGSFASIVTDVSHLYDGTTDLIYGAANLSTQFDSEYKGFSNWVAGMSGMDFNATYTNMAKELRDNVKYALEGLDTNFKYYKNIHQGIMDQLNTMNEDPEGQTKAIQATNETLMHLTNITTRLHTTLMKQSSLQLQYRAMENERREIDRAHTEANHDIAPFTHATTTMPDH